MQVLTKTLIKESEENAVKSGAFSFGELMFVAGNTAARIIDERLDCRNKKIAVICGNGNNGGDGCVLARYFYEHGADVTVITPMGAPLTENAEYYYKMLEYVKKANVFSGEYDIIIDAVFGTGLSRPLDNSVIALFEKINSSAAVKVAIDIPSGVEADTGKVLGAAVKADFTITFIALKPCFMLPEGSDYCGEVIVADIGVPTSGYSFLTTEKPKFEKRLHNAHKGSFGTALLLCGSYGMAGAAILAAKAALRSGVGIAKCVLCDGIYTAFTSAIPEAVCLPLKQSQSGTFKGDIDITVVTKGSDALLFGCGVGQGEDVDILLESVVEKSEIPTVIDADGINALSRRINILKKSKAPIILTPHPGEMARLCGISVAEVEADRLKISADFAQKNNCTVVLKGADTVIAEPDGTLTVNLTGNSGMATAGCGDVLAGMIVSLLAQGISPADAAKAAVYLHGEAGDKATARKGERSMLASDIIDEL